MFSKSSQKTTGELKVGDILSSNSPTNHIPVTFSMNRDGESRWVTFAVFEDGQWELKWVPKGGLSVFMHKKNFQELENFPYVNKVKIVKILSRAVIAEIYE